MRNSHYFLFRLLVCFVLIGCSKNTDDSSYLNNELDATSFTLKVPEGWELIIDQGIDTYIGRIMNENDTIYFDYGYLSFGGLDRVDEDENTLSFERLTINGASSIIVKEERPEEINSTIRLSVYIDSGDGENLNRLYVFDPSDEGLMRSIFKSHKFK